MRISIVTPWMGISNLLPDYLRATEGAELIFVDNGSNPEDAKALEQAASVYIRNEENRGFAYANNQGYAAATGDTIIFLNSDIAGEPAWLWGVKADVKAGALYGPALQQQLVHGDMWPYLEGWCVAATRETWGRLRNKTIQPNENPESLLRIERTIGPWDAKSYPGPYWEDNDLCLRATEAGISLVQTAWPIQHKGGRTAGPLLKHGESFEKNRATFVKCIEAHAAAKRAIEGTPTYAAYLHHCAAQSDIQHHLPVLFSLAKGHVVELGTRSGVSTAALLAGVERHGGRVVSVDVDPNSAQVAAGHPQWSFIQASSTDLTTRGKAGGPIDLLLIDTIHTYGHVAAELEVWSSAMSPGGSICVHDTETFPGVRVAIEEFCAKTGWGCTFVRPCNGMGVIEVPE